MALSSATRSISLERYRKGEISTDRPISRNREPDASVDAAHHGGKADAASAFGSPRVWPRAARVAISQRRHGVTGNSDASGLMMMTRKKKNSLIVNN